jgi:hypothetical protein
MSDLSLVIFETGGEGANIYTIPLDKGFRALH